MSVSHRSRIAGILGGVVLLTVACGGNGVGSSGDKAGGTGAPQLGFVLKMAQGNDAPPDQLGEPGANGRLVFSRQICQTDEDPCWEIVVANATDTEETVVAGPYPRSVWDDHFVANWAPDGQSMIFMADLGTGQGIWQVNADGSDFHEVFAAPPGSGLDDGPAFTPDGTAIIFTAVLPAEAPGTGYGGSMPTERG